MLDFHTLVVGDGIDPMVAHREFLKIDEYAAGRRGWSTRDRGISIINVKWADPPVPKAGQLRTEKVEGGRQYEHPGGIPRRVHHRRAARAGPLVDAGALRGRRRSRRASAQDPRPADRASAALESEDA